MPLRQKRDTKAQSSYWRRAYGKIHAALEARIKHNSLESAFVILKSKKYLALSYVPFVSLIPFHSILFRVLLISVQSLQVLDDVYWYPTYVSVMLANFPRF